VIKFVSDLQQVDGFLWVLVSSTYKTDCHDITEILLNVALNTITRVGSSCSTSGTRRVNLVTNPIISNCDISILPLVDSGL
jgi:hypothetical protein